MLISSALEEQKTLFKHVFFHLVIMMLHVSCSYNIIIAQVTEIVNAKYNSYQCLNVAETSKRTQ